MLLPFKKKTDDQTTAPGTTAADIDYSEFIPYYCHYNPHTLLTKNGELVQIIKVAVNTRGLEYESGEGENGSLRDLLREALTSQIGNANFSFWMHTIRKRKQVNFATRFKENFASYAHKKWQKKHRWTHQYYNEIYVTLLHSGQSCELLDKKALKFVTLSGRNRIYRNAYLDQGAQALDDVTSGILSVVGKHYDAKRLSAVERLPLAQNPNATHSIFYSEPMEFLGTLLNLQAEEYPMPDVDLSVALNTHHLTFGFNALESKNNEGKRRFGALLTLKQYREVPAEMVDLVLQAPMELIISQAFHFEDEENVTWQYRDQRELFQISGDDYSMKASGLKEMMSDTGKPLAYGLQQTSIMVLADEYKMLAGEVTEVQAAFAKLGLITVREDIKLEEGFWSQLPGNFEFLRRKDPILTSQAAGFCRLNRFPSGSAQHNHWGAPVALIPTIVNSPYFFNFHHQDNGHSVLFDFNSFGDPAAIVLTNFLLTETRKYNGRLFIFDRNKSARLFFDKLGSSYHQPLSAKADLQLNPFALEDSPRNQSFLIAWCSALLSSHMTVTDAHKQALKQAITQMNMLPAKERSLSHLIAQLTPLDANLAQALSAWHGSGSFANLFDAASENLDLRQPAHAFDMDNAIAQPETVIPLFSYLLHRIITTLDGRPTIIVLHEAWDLLENAFFAPRMESLLEMLQQSNVMVLFTTKSPASCIGTHTLETVMKCCATRMYVPDDIGIDYESQELKLNAHDARMLHKMDRQKGDFLVRQNEEAIGLRASLEGLDDLFAIYSNNIKNLIAAGGEFANLPDTV